MAESKIDYQGFIEDNFQILDSETQQPVPFKFKPVQERYYKLLTGQYPNLDGTREILCKARQEGFSSFVLALFTVDFIFVPYSVSLCISHRKDATELLFKKVKFYLESYCQKNGMDIKDYLLTDNKGIIESRYKHSVFYIATAGAKVGGRGASARNVHFSEVAYYLDTDIITASEIVEGTAQQVPQGKGKIFLESTANGIGNFYQKEWERSNKFDKEGKRVSSYTPRFFGWQEFYTKEWVEEKRKNFSSEAKFQQEYPSNAQEAFIASGTPFFDNLLLEKMKSGAPDPIWIGRLAPDGMPV